MSFKRQVRIAYSLAGPIPFLAANQIKWNKMNTGNIIDLLIEIGKGIAAAIFILIMLTLIWTLWDTYYCSSWQLAPTTALGRWLRYEPRVTPASMCYHDPTDSDRK
jgi:hypothetical protein